MNRVPRTFKNDGRQNLRLKMDNDNKIILARYRRLVEMNYSYEQFQKDIAQAILDSNTRIELINEKYTKEELGFPE